MPASSTGHLSGSSPVAFDIKSAQLSAVALHLRSSDWSLVISELHRQYGPGSESADFFDHDPVVIDFSHLEHDAPVQDLLILRDTLLQCQLKPVGVRAATGDWLKASLALGWSEFSPEMTRAKATRASDSASAAEVHEIVKEVVREVVREIPGPATMVVDRPLRSGQKIYARGGDLVVLAIVNQGAEIVADGNIHVYAPLRGKAMAGARGNTNARIFSLCLEPELISIAGVYRTSENPLHPDVQGKAAQIRLSSDGQEKLIFEALNN
jgi:septum site-determining protein MinC